MQSGSTVPWLSLLLALTSFVSCDDCDRAGCDALDQAAAQRGTGVAGVVAAASDVVENGCEECGFGQATLQIWQTQALVVTQAEAVALVGEGEPDVLELISERYERALGAAPYLLCARPNCVAVTVAEGETLTVNIKRRDGPTGFFVGGPEAAPFEENFGFDVGY